VKQACLPSAGSEMVQEVVCGFRRRAVHNLSFDEQVTGFCKTRTGSITCPLIAACREMSLCLPPLLLIAAILSSAAITAGVAPSEGASIPALSARYFYRSHRHQLQFLSPDRGFLSTPAPVLRALRGGIDWMQSESESALDPESPRGLAGAFGSAPPRVSLSECPALLSGSARLRKWAVLRPHEASMAPFSCVPCVGPLTATLPARWGKTDEFGEKVVDEEKPAYLRGMEEPASAHDSEESDDSEWRFAHP